MKALSCIVGSKVGFGEGFFFFFYLIFPEFMMLPNAKRVEQTLGFEASKDFIFISLIVASLEKVARMFIALASGDRIALLKLLGRKERTRQCFFEAGVIEQSFFSSSLALLSSF